MYYRSVKEALGHVAATHSRCGRVRRPSSSSSSTNRDEWSAVAVLACLSRVGVDPHGEVAAELIRWASAPDDVQAASDLEAEQLGEPNRARRVRLWGQVERARRDLAAELDRHGMLWRSRPMPAAGYRVGRAGGRMLVLRVPDPDPRDPGVVRAHTRAEAISLAEAKGLVVDLADPTIAGVRDRLRLEALDAARLGAAMRTIDDRLIEALGLTRQSARRLRRSWGIRGVRGFSVPVDIYCAQESDHAPS